MTGLSLDGLTQKVLDLEKECAGRHTRTGETLADHQDRLDRLKDEIDRIGAEERSTAQKLETLSKTPIDAA